MRVIPLLIVAIEILNALSLNSVKLRPDDVLAYLDRIHNSEIDKYRRDNFINIPTNTTIQEITAQNKAIELTILGRPIVEITNLVWIAPYRLITKKI